MVAPKQALTEGQRAYEARRAKKAGMTLEKWLAEKDRAAGKAISTAEKLRLEKAKSAKPPGFFSRLLEKAQKPL